VTGRPPPPRTGRITTGGPNSIELLWATAAAVAITAAAGACTALYAAVRLDHLLAGTDESLQLADTPRLLAATLTRDLTALADHTPDATRVLVLAGLVGLVLLAVVSAAAQRWWAWQASWRHRRRSDDRAHAHIWATRRQLRHLTQPAPRTGQPEPPAEGRLWVGQHAGRDVCVPPRTSVIVIAPTRTGKSTRLVVPNLLRWDGPALVTSVKRDIYDLTAARRAHHGPVHLFDPTGSSGLDSVRWSPLLTSTTFPDATTTARWLTDAATIEDRHDGARFWEALATKLLAPMLYAAATTGRTIHDVSLWVDRSDFDHVHRLLARLGDADAIAAWHAITELPHETRGSVLGTAMAIFRGFGNPRVRDATSCTPTDTANTLDIDQLLATNGTLYLIAPEYEQADLRPVFVAIVQAVYRAAIARTALLDGAPLDPPLLLMLDEAGNIAPLPALPKIASTGAGQGITLMTIWQDRAQIRQLYNDAERTVIANHTTSVWLPGSQDLDTLKLLTDLIGDQQTSTTSVSTAADGGISISESGERIDVAPPAFLRTLEHGTAVMLSGNTAPALLTTAAYHQQHRWRRLIDPHQLARYRGIHLGVGVRTANPQDREGPASSSLSKHPRHSGPRLPAAPAECHAHTGRHSLAGCSCHQGHLC
jgi:type IV secretion system protein VirD4